MLAHRSLVPRTRAGRSMVGSGTLLVALAGSALFVGAPTVANASSHREAPLIAGNPKADNTDTYAFVSADAPGMVNLVANWIPFEEPNGGPNFYPFADGAHYDIHVDSDGDGVADTTYQWTFTSHVKHDGGSADTTAAVADTFLYNTGQVTSLDDPDLNFTQTYSLDVIKTATGTTAASTTRVLTDVAAAPSDTGPTSMPDYGTLRDQAVVAGTFATGGGGKSYAGQADDSFFLDLRVFDLLYGASQSSAGHFTEAGTDSLAGYNVNTIALQVPQTSVAFNGNIVNNPNIGVWATTEEQTTDLASGDKTGSFVQVSRLGQPLVNEVVVPRSLKDAFNSIPPSADHTVQKVVDYVLHPTVPKLVEGIYGVPAPAEPRNDIAEIFLTGLSKKAKTVDGTNSAAPLQITLNSQLDNSDVTTAFVPAEELRLNMSVPPTADPKRLGVLAGDIQGFPNGRRLTDDVVDIELLALEGALSSPAADTSALANGDDVYQNDVAFSPAFPYVALPHNTNVNAATGAAPVVTTVTVQASSAATTAAAAATTAAATGTTGTISGQAANTLPQGGVPAGAGGLASSTTSVATSGTSTLALIAGAAGLGLIGAGAITLRRSRRSAAQA